MSMEELRLDPLADIPESFRDIMAREELLVPIERLDASLYSLSSQQVLLRASSSSIAVSGVTDSIGRSDEFLIFNVTGICAVDGPANSSQEEEYSIPSNDRLSIFNECFYVIAKHPPRTPSETTLANAERFGDPSRIEVVKYKMPEVKKGNVASRKRKVSE
jgi:hypothetical protein